MEMTEEEFRKRKSELESQKHEGDSADCEHTWKGIVESKEVKVNVQHKYGVETQTWDLPGVWKCLDCNKIEASSHQPAHNYKGGLGYVGEDPCFIATAAYGTPLAPQLDILRAFRDSCLPKLLVKTYYRLSPPIADAIRTRNHLRLSVRVALKPLLELLKRGS